MELQQLRALIMVAEAGSVTEAARRLLLTQPAVTRQIRALEEELGGALFDRTTKPIIPTPLGKSALNHARRILLMAEELRTAISSDAGTLRGELRLGVGASWARQVIPPITLQLREQYPGLQLRLKTGWSGSLTRQVESELLDAAVVLVPPQAHVPTGLSAIRLAEEPVGLISSRKTPLNGRVGAEALRETTWVLNAEGCGHRATLKRALEQLGIPLTVAVEVNDLDLQVQLIREGVGAGIMPLRALPQRLAEAGLQVFNIADVNFSLEVRLLYRRTGPIILMAVPLIERTVSRLLMSARTKQTAQQTTSAVRRRARRPQRAHPR